MTSLLQYFDSADFTTAELIRTLEGGYIEGAWVPGAEQTPHPIISLIIPKPLKEKEIRLLPEGESPLEHLKTWTEFELNTREGKVEADQLLYRGNHYKVWSVSDRLEKEGFFKVIIRKLVE